MEQLKKVLAIWMKLSTHVFIRDRSVKILQYGCQMLLGFYGSKLSKSTIEMLSLTRKTASSSRKAFWLLKSLNNVAIVIDMIQQYSLDKDEALLNLWCIAEQFFLIIYYWYENLVFLRRNKLIATTEDSLDSWGNPSWFLEDFCCFVASVLRILIHTRKYKDKQAKLLELRITSLEEKNDSTVITKESSEDVEAVALLKLELQQMQDEFHDGYVSCAIALAEVLVSADYVHLWKHLFGKDMGNGPVGFFGVLSSVLTLYRGTSQAYKEVW